MLYIIRPDNDVLKRVYEHLGNLDLNKSWDVSIEAHKHNRTKQQNSYLHVIIKIYLREYQGWITEDAITQKKRQLAWNSAIFDEYITEDRQKILFPKETKHMTVEELNKIISMISVECMDKGYRIPAPKYMRERFGHDSY